MDKISFELAKKVPGIRKKMEEELEKFVSDSLISMHDRDPKTEPILKLPSMPMKNADILELAEKYQEANPYKFDDGSVSGVVYGKRENDQTELLGKIYEKYMWDNPLHPEMFPGVRRMEAEVVRMCLDLYKGDEKACGIMTTGGTESILLAVLASRNRAYSRGISKPRIVLPKTAHAAFDKGGKMFGIELDYVPMDCLTGECDMTAMAEAITKNTCMLVGSAPNYPHGVMDPISDIAQLGKEHDIPVHVDACLGGFLIPFMHGDLDPFCGTGKHFDFSVPGVTSISCDMHKYAFAPKGTSIVMYRNFGLMKQQFTDCIDWPGGIYATPTLAGSRCGANIATCWATFLMFGRNQYESYTQLIIKTARYIQGRIVTEIPELCLIGKPTVSVIAFECIAFNVYCLVDEMNKKGWFLSSIQNPPGFHVAVTLNHCKKKTADSFVWDLKDACKQLGSDPNPPRGPTAVVYGSTKGVGSNKNITREFVNSYLGACLSTAPDQTKTLLVLSSATKRVVACPISDVPAARTSLDLYVWLDKSVSSCCC